MESVYQINQSFDGVLNNLEKAYNNKDFIIFNEFLSTTLDIKVAEKFIDRTGYKMRWEMEVENPISRLFSYQFLNISPFSIYNDKEAEILFNPFNVFKVKKIYEEDEVKVIVLTSCVNLIENLYKNEFLKISHNKKNFGICEQGDLLNGFENDILHLNLNKNFCPINNKLNSLYSICIRNFNLKKTKEFFEIFSLLKNVQTIEIQNS